MVFPGRHEAQGAAAEGVLSATAFTEEDSAVGGDAVDEIVIIGGGANAGAEEAPDCS